MNNKIKKLILDEKKDINKETLTIEEFRGIKGFENIESQEAEKLSEFINSIAELLYTFEFKT